MYDRTNRANTLVVRVEPGNPRLSGASAKFRPLLAAVQCRAFCAADVGVVDPDVGMFVCIPGDRCSFDRLLNLLPGFEASAFERERLEGFPPGFNQIPVGRVGGLKHKLEAADARD